MPLSLIRAYYLKILLRDCLAQENFLPRDKNHNWMGKTKKMSDDYSPVSFVGLMNVCARLEAYSSIYTSRSSFMSIATHAGNIYFFYPYFRVPRMIFLSSSSRRKIR